MLGDLLVTEYIHCADTPAMVMLIAAGANVVIVLTIVLVLMNGS